MDHVNDVIIVNELSLITVKLFHAARLELTYSDVLVSDLTIELFV